MVKRSPIKTTKKQKSFLPPIKCKGCSSAFVPHDRRQHFHSASCRESYYQRTYFSKISARLICPNCNTTFTTSKPGRQVYCSTDCRVEALQKRRNTLTDSLSTERKTLLSSRFATMQNDGFKCVYCGKGAHDGVKLDVEKTGDNKLQTVCNICIEGRESSNDSGHNTKLT